MKPKIGFVGVGRMGSNMARRLHDCGYPVAAVYDAHVDTAKLLAEELGAVAVSSLAAVSEAADIIITVVTNDAAMNAIYDTRADDHLLLNASGKLILNCATITPAIHVEIEKNGEAAGVDILEAPMASSISQARAGTLYMMLGGRKEVYERAQPLLADLTSSSRHIGAAGTASQVKALVNMIMNINTAGLAEGLGLADALGLDLDTVIDVFSQTGANSRVLETDGPDMVARDHETYFSASHAAKDSGIAVALGEDCGIAVPMAVAAKGQFDKLVTIGCGEMDKSAVSELTFRGRRVDG